MEWRVEAHQTSSTTTKPAVRCGSAPQSSAARSGPRDRPVKLRCQAFVFALVLTIHCRPEPPQQIALVDDAWCTIGSANIGNRSFYGDTELNASIWHAATVRELRHELLQEHLGRDTSDLDDVAALTLYREIARENARRSNAGEALEGLALALDPATYAS